MRRSRHIAGTLFFVCERHRNAALEAFDACTAACAGEGQQLILSRRHLQVGFGAPATPSAWAAALTCLATLADFASDGSIDCRCPASAFPEDLRERFAAGTPFPEEQRFLSFDFFCRHCRQPTRLVFLPREERSVSVTPDIVAILEPVGSEGPALD